MANRAALVIGLRWIPALIWMGWIFWLSSQQALPPPPGLSYTVVAIAGYFVLYAILTALLLIAVGSLRRLDRRTAMIVAMAAFGYALSDEYHQSFVPRREASAFDLLVDASGIAFTVTVWLYGWRRIATS
ncbi:hypothetical protein BH23CHL2_BH23CHL2_19130 [soil metagenome]